MTAEQKVISGLLSKPAFGDLAKKVDGLWAEGINQYLAAADLRGDEPTQKSIKDSIWGMIDLSAKEVFVIDSPPFQRLRRVRQLGVSFLTYPTAGYSRFEHTLGVMHQVSRMMRAIALSSKDESLSKNTEVLRLAALVHDLGHLPFSHVSEQYFSPKECATHEEALFVGQLIRCCKEATSGRVEKAALAEILSMMIVISPAFQNLLKKAGYGEEDISIAALLIIGMPPAAPHRAFLPQILSNVIDADKLDYMFRDAAATGVPLGVDLDRLLYKLRCYTVDPAKFPRLCSLNRPDEHPVVMATDLGGYLHARDVIMSRVLLHERVYGHHKTRAAERVVLKILANAKFSIVDLLGADDSIFSNSGKHAHPSQNGTYLKMLEDRTLPKRIFGFSYGFLLENAITTEDGKVRIPDEITEAWQDFIEVLGTLELREILAEEIKERHLAWKELLGGGRPYEFDLWIDVTRSIEVQDLNLPVRCPDGVFQKEGFRPQGAAFPQTTFLNSFIYASGLPSFDFPLLYVAIEYVLEKRFKMHLGRVAADYAKQNWEHIENTKREIEKKDGEVFRSTRAIRPLSAASRLALNSNKIQSLAERFSTYNVGPDGMSAARIENFLDQFPEHLVEPMIQILENVTFLKRDDLGRKMVDFMRNGVGEEVVFVPLTQDKQKSAGHLNYYFGDSASKLVILSLDEALAADHPKIVFYDDLILSGKQSAATAQIWFGLPPCLDEKNLASPLTEHQRQILKARQVSFRFRYALSGGIDFLGHVTEEIGLGKNIKAMAVGTTPESGIRSFLDKATSDRLQDFLSQVGFNTLMATKHQTDSEKWTEELCRSRSFGYSGRGLLVVSHYNCPTSTITALWKKGPFGNANWKPLFPRREE